MPKAIYRDHDRCAPVVTWDGVEFRADERTEVPAEHPATLGVNRYFEPVKAGRPTGSTAAEAAAPEPAEKAASSP